MSNSKHNRIVELVLSCSDGNATSKDLDELQKYLINDRAAVDLYIEIMLNLDYFQGEIQTLYTVDHARDSISRNLNVDEEIFKKTIAAMAQNEEKAPEVIIEKPAELKIEKSDSKPVDKHPNKFFRIYNTLVSAAAVILIFFVIYVNVNPPQYSVTVATVTDQVGVKWSSASERLKAGERIYTNQPSYVIEQGIVKIIYDQGVDVIIEGPAEFMIENKGIRLDRGRLYSLVSEYGHGFTVDSPGIMFIDLGTEFGIEVSNNGSSELHVLDGEVQYYAGLEKESKQCESVTRGNAISYDLHNGQVKSIPVREKTFVREIISRSNMIWRGENTINLADLLAGGNGFGTSKELVSIDPGSGVISNVIKTGANICTDNQYFSVEENVYIDGVFAPYGGETPLLVTSLGHIFKECPVTTGEYYMGISNISASNIASNNENPEVFHNISLDGIQYGTSEHPGILMHSNSGITFDLDEIRSVNPRNQIRRFTSTSGMPETLTHMYKASVVIWVLIDGNVVKQETLDQEERSKIKINVEIKDEDRFLTLISTDDTQDIDNDWTLFGDPALHFE